MKTVLKKVECVVTNGVSATGKPYTRLSILDRNACEKISVFCPADVAVNDKDRYDVTVNLSSSGKYYFDSISKV